MNRYLNLLIGTLSLCSLSLTGWAVPTPPPQESEREREEMLFGGEEDEESAEDEFSNGRVQEESQPLEVGGQLYMQLGTSIADSTQVKDHIFQAPTLFELFLDSRPNDQLRGFARGRITWNPSTQPESTGTESGEARTSVLLDELWMKFDANRTVFFTLGQAHVRWGATRIWNPVDVLQPTRKDPLSFYDQRVGVPQLKMHIPIESLGWNFYLIGLTDSVQTFDQAGAGARAEFVFSTVEMGLTGAFRSSADPKAGLDLSMGIGDLDWTAECGLTFPDSSDPDIQISTGLEYGISVFDNDVLYIGTEFFYNPNGYDSLEEAVYDKIGVTPEEVDAGFALIEPTLNGESGDTTETSDLIIDDSTSQWINQTLASLNEIEPFYLGKLYGGILISLPNPGSWNEVSFSFLTLSNLSDKSALSRFDVSFTLLRDLQLQTYVTGFWGLPGELRFGPGAWGTLKDKIEVFVELPPTQLMQVGLNLRMTL